MDLPSPAIADRNWLEANELYLTTGDDCEVDRPLFQGDVIHGVSLPQLPAQPPAPGPAQVTFALATVMVLPHPCQCYHGDKLRSFLTVAPVTEVPNYTSFGEDHTGAKDKFALLDLPVSMNGAWERRSHVADFGRLISVRARYLDVRRRSACLSHMGLGLLAKRLLQFQLRAPSELAQVMAFTQKQWNEAFVMHAWVRHHGSLKGYTDWMRTEQTLPGLGDSLRPDDFVVGALETLLGMLEMGGSVEE